MKSAPTVVQLAESTATESETAGFKSWEVLLMVISALAALGCLVYILSNSCTGDRSGDLSRAEGVEGMMMGDEEDPMMESW